MAPPGRPRRPVRPREGVARAVVELLAIARRDAGMTRQRLSHLSGVSPNTIAKIEQTATTDPSFTIVVNLADALGLPLEALAQRARQRSRQTRKGTTAGQSDDKRESEA